MMTEVLADNEYVVSISTCNKASQLPDLQRPPWRDPSSLGNVTHTFQQNFTQAGTDMNEEVDIDNDEYAVPSVA